jgi:hypothetical protein
MSIWDLFQQYQIYNQEKNSDSLEERVLYLENQMRQTREIMGNLLKYLEKKFGEDLDGDERIG